MNDQDWLNFVAGGEPAVVSVARLPHDLCRVIGCSSSLIRMTHDYALKCAYKHRLKPHHFPMLPIVIECGRVICDRQRHLTFYYADSTVFGQWLAATIKTNKAGNELWVATFHFTSAAEAKRIAQKHGVIREQKR